MEDMTPNHPRPPMNQLGTVEIILSTLLPLIFSLWVICAPFDDQLHNSALWLMVIAAAVGLLIPAVHQPAWRALGYVPLGLAIFSLSGLMLMLWDHRSISLLALVMFSIGLIVSGCVRFLMIRPTKSAPDGLDRDQPDAPLVWEHYVTYCMITFFLLEVVFYLIIEDLDTRIYRLTQYLFFAFLALHVTVFAWVRLIRHVYELWVESWARWMYKIRVVGPGTTEAPVTGPLLVIANHACWWDPLFIAGKFPRPITPMMTSTFYDIWHLKPFMKHVIRAIRVPEGAVRHEAPEIAEAVAALDRGECVVIFPEGWLRRKEEVPLRRFGRGVAEILKARPRTPVIACWIEGAWGSWCSWKDGPPTKNKRFDLRRRITVGMSAPFTVPEEILENLWTTRIHLMNAVSHARTHVGLEPLPEFTMPQQAEERLEP